MRHARGEPPAIGAPVELQLPRVHHVLLPNGLDLRIVERRELPVVDVRLVVRSGASLDPPASAGRAFLTADVLDEGTTSRTGPEIADEAELLGASLFTRATWDQVSVGLHVLAQRLEPALALLADVVLHPAFREEDVARKRSERLAAILQEQDEPRSVAGRTFARVVYGGAHPYGAPLGGTAASVQRLDADVLRAFHAAAFSPVNAFAVIVGDVAAGDAVSLLEKLFGAWRGDAAAPASLPAVVPPPSRTIHLVDRAGAPQSELRAGLAGPPRTSPDYFPLVVGNTILGGAFTSRLNMRLREEKAYTYGASSNFAFRVHGGPFAAATAVHTAATADAVNDIISEVSRLGREPVSAEELERAQRYLVLGLPRTFETTGDVAEHISEVALFALGDDWYARYAARVSEVTAERIAEAAARWLPPDRLSVVVVGDAAAVHGELESLGTAAVERRTGEND